MPELSQYNVSPLPSATGSQLRFDKSPLACLNVTPVATLHDPLVWKGNKAFRRVRTYSFVILTSLGMAYVGTPCDRRKVHRFLMADASVSGVSRSRVIPAAPAWPS